MSLSLSGLLRCGFGRLRVTKRRCDEKRVSRARATSRKRSVYPTITLWRNFTAIAVVVATTRPFSETLRRPSRGALFSSFWERTRPRAPQDATRPATTRASRYTPRERVSESETSPRGVDRRRGRSGETHRLARESRPNRDPTATSHANFSRLSLVRGSTPSIRRHPPTWRLTSRPGARWACPRAGGRLPTFPRRRPPPDAPPRAVRPRAGPARHPVAGRRCPARTGPCARW